MPPVFTTEMFQAAFLKLLPNGAIWRKSEGGVAHALGRVFGKIFSKNSDRASNLLIDANPSFTKELLPEWEETLGLPDPCAGASPTLEQRRAQVMARLTDSGGCSVNYFIEFAKSLG
ncbi:MAG: putative phage tail protein, partial [Acetobacter sp.]|uniref:putative phage tail protein n=1 Tax=Acetobacter sp. TaxID=440 RepID=UPI003F92FC27